jgi:hypothetical protein
MVNGRPDCSAVIVNTHAGNKMVVPEPGPEISFTNTHLLPANATNVHRTPLKTVFIMFLMIMYRAPNFNFKLLGGAPGMRMPATISFGYRSGCLQLRNVSAAKACRSKPAMV